jgi:hypothetical protein
MSRPTESDYVSHVAYTRALEEYCNKVEPTSADYAMGFAEGFNEGCRPRPWVGLTPEEVLDLFDVNNVYGSKWIEFARTVEAKLKEKNT